MTNPTAEAVLREQFERVSDNMRGWQPGSTRRERRGDTYKTALLSQDWSFFQFGHAALATPPAPQPDTLDARTVEAFRSEIERLDRFVLPQSPSMGERADKWHIIGARETMTKIRKHLRSFLDNLPTHSDVPDGRTAREQALEEAARALLERSGACAPEDHFDHGYQAGFTDGATTVRQLIALAPQHKDAGDAS